MAITDEMDDAEKQEKAKGLLSNVPLVGDYLQKSPQIMSIAGKFQSMLDGFTDKINAYVFHFLAERGLGVSKAEIPAKATILSNVANSDVYAKVSASLDVDSNTAQTLQTICSGTVKNLYGITGLNSDPRKTGASLMKAHGKLVFVLTDALIAKGMSEEEATAKATAAATVMIGVDEGYLDTKHLSARLKHALPTTGLAGIVFTAQDRLAANPKATHIEVPAFVLDDAALTAALVTQQAPATPNPTAAQQAASEAVANNTTPVKPTAASEPLQLSTPRPINFQKLVSQITTPA